MKTPPLYQPAPTIVQANNQKDKISPLHLKMGSIPLKLALWMRVDQKTIISTAKWVSKARLQRHEATYTQAYSNTLIEGLHMKIRQEETVSS